MSDERFARQYRFELPSRFPVTSLCTSIVHHLSGPNIRALVREDTLPAMRPEGLTRFELPSHWSFNYSNTRTHIRLLGPCFKTGRIRRLAEAEHQNLITRPSAGKPPQRPLGPQWQQSTRRA